MEALSCLKKAGASYKELLSLVLCEEVRLALLAVVACCVVVVLVF